MEDQSVQSYCGGDNIQKGTFCPNCQTSLRYIQEYGNWYCDSCGLYPYPPLMTTLYPPPKSDTTKIILMVVLVLVILFVVVPMIIAVIFLFSTPMMTGTTTTPTGAMSFTATSVGNYTGGIIALSDQVDVEDVTLIIIDVSLGSSASLDPLRHGGSASVFGGMSCTFFESNQNGNLDAGDIFTIESGSSGDIIRLVYFTGGAIAEYTLE